MVDPQGVELGTARLQDDCLVARARGEVTAATVTDLRMGLEKLLAEGLPVLLDVSGLRLTWSPGPEVFVAAVTAAGGWPLARLVLFGADAAAADRLTACRVAESVPLAGTAAEAAGLVGLRPARLARGRGFPADVRAARAARHFLRDTLAQWELPEHAGAETVVTELAANAVRHAATPFRLRLVLDDKGLRISVRDRRPGAVPHLPGLGLQSPSGHGLHLVARLSRSWGVLHFADGKSVWAVLAPAPRVVTAAPTVAPDPTEKIIGRPGGRVRTAAPADARSAAAVTPPRRQRYATADPEQAHEFLRALYGEHTLRLSGGADFSGFQLEYEGRSTNRFSVERLLHTMPFEGEFAPTDALVVVRPIGGGLRVATCGATQEAGPGHVLLVDGAAGPRVRWTQLNAEVVRLDPAAVALIAAELADVDPATVRFGLAQAVSPARAALWAATVAHVRDDVLPNDEVMASPLSRSTAFRHLVAALVEAFPGPALDAVTAAGAGRIAPAALRRAVRYIEEHAGDDIGLVDIAAAARLGPRGLQLAFRRHHDVTPLEYLRHVRLERAHRDLQAGNPVDDMVGAIASRWGFTHHGNFAAAYLRAYGRSPSVTLRS